MADALNSGPALVALGRDVGGERGFAEAYDGGQPG